MDRVSPILSRTRLPGAVAGVRRSITLSLLLVFVACQTAPRPIEGTQATPEALATAVLDALAGRDEARLRALALSEAEFRARIWPELPASLPERNLSADYVWRDLAQKSDASLRGVVARLGGQRLTLRAVDFRGETTPYATFSVSRQTELVVADEHGAEQRVRVFGSLIRVDGGVKVFSYVVD
jgi:hypothetical protein